MRDPCPDALWVRREALPELVNESVESAESARQTEVVAVVARLDDAAVPYADDEDAWQLEGLAAYRAGVSELDYDEFGIHSAMDDHMYRLEPLGSAGATSCGREVCA